jgi:hypothetical protein
MQMSVTIRVNRPPSATQYTQGVFYGAKVPITYGTKTVKYGKRSSMYNTQIMYPMYIHTTLYKTHMVYPRTIFPWRLSREGTGDSGRAPASLCRRAPRPDTRMTYRNNVHTLLLEYITILDVPFKTQMM